MAVFVVEEGLFRERVGLVRDAMIDSTQGSLLPVAIVKKLD